MRTYKYYVCNVDLLPDNVNRLPGHRNVLHVRDSLGRPSLLQSLPSYAGGGWYINGSDFEFLHHMNCYTETKQTTASNHHEMRRDAKKASTPLHTKQKYCRQKITTWQSLFL